MSVGKRPARGLQDIRTHAGKVDRLTLPHMAYMAITCLEMEKARKEMERESAMNRVTNIDARLREIEKEKTGILNQMDRRKAGASPSCSRSKSDSCMTGEGFRIKY